MEHEICAFDDIEDGGKRVARVGVDPLLLLRSGDEVFAIRNRCPHMNLPLSVGSFDGTHIKCRFHGSRYDVRTGHRNKRAWLLGGVGGDRVDCFPVHVRDGRVFVEV